MLGDAGCEGGLRCCGTVLVVLLDLSEGGCAGAGMGSRCNTNCPCRLVPGSGRLNECGAHETLMMLRHGSDADHVLSGAGLACPSCGHLLAPWGYARRRSVRGHDGTTQLSPRRGRCRGCRTTHVLFPASCLPRRAVTVQVVGEVLLAKVRGASHRRNAADLGLPADTVRRATANVSWLSECATIIAVRLDSKCAPILPNGTPLGDALEALGSAAAATARRPGPDVPPWERIAHFTNWRLLSPVARAG